MQTTTLAGIAQTQRLAPKWLVAPSLRVGHQWLENVVRDGQPLINFRVFTVRSLASELAAPEMLDRQLMLVDSLASAMLVGALWEQTKSTYLGSLRRTPSLDRAIHDSLVALRLAGLAPDQIRPEAFEVPSKAHEIQDLLARYEQELQRLKLVDHADILKMASSRLTQDADALPPDLILLLPPDLELCGLERRLLGRMPPQHVYRLGWPIPVADHGSDLRLLASLLEHDVRRVARNDGTVELYRAIGPVNEVREVFRRCINQSRALDRVELLHTDSQTYVPLIYELVVRLASDHDAGNEPPVTFAEGIPASYTRPGRALLAWLTWIQEGYLQHHFARMVHDGLLNLKTDDGDVSLTTLASHFRRVPIGWGRDRYLPKLKDELKNLRAAILAQKASREPNEGAIAGYERRQKALQILHRCLESILKISTSNTDDPKFLAQAIQFLQRTARTASAMDQVARKRLIESIQRFMRAIELCEGRCCFDLSDWLKDLVGQTTVMESGPRAGHLHVAHISVGGHSGRPETFVVGLDDSRFPGASHQDPILLDGERQRLDENLPISAAEQQRCLKQFVALFARLRGRVTLSYSCWELVDDRELFPSNVMLATYRTLSGDADADQRSLERLPLASFVAGTSNTVIDETEWWLSNLISDQQINDRLDVVGQRFPHLARGRQAAAHRHSNGMTAFDGWVPQAGFTVDAGARNPAFSASALETVGHCPLRYFFRYPLRVRPPEDLVLDVERWLDPLSFGSLLHEVFRKFFVALRKQSRRPQWPADKPLLFEILRTEIQQYRETIPPPNEPAFRRQYRQLHRAARVFLVTESRFANRACPNFWKLHWGSRAMEKAPSWIAINRLR